MPTYCTFNANEKDENEQLEILRERVAREMYRYVEEKTSSPMLPWEDAHPNARILYLNLAHIAMKKITDFSKKRIKEKRY